MLDRGKLASKHDLQKRDKTGAIDHYLNWNNCAQNRKFHLPRAYGAV